MKLSDEQQTWVAYVMEKDEIVPSTEQTAELKRLAQAGKLTEEVVDKVMNDYTEPVASKVTLQGNFLKKYPYFADKTATQIERVVDKALSEYFRNHSKATLTAAPPRLIAATVRGRKLERKIVCPFADAGGFFYFMERRRCNDFDWLPFDDTVRYRAHNFVVLAVQSNKGENI